MSYKDKIVVVTGGANGIGRCVAEAFLAAGAQVLVLDRDEKAGRRLAEQCGPGLVFMPCDLCERSSIDACVDAIRDRFGAVDILINNACVSAGGIASGCGWDDFMAVLAVGVVAPYYLCLRLRELFRAGASVINLSSTRAFQSQRNTESYSAAKGGITALTHALAMSLAGTARVNSVAPGWIDTREYREAPPAGLPDAADCLQHPSGRIGRPEDIAGLILYLCGDDASFINGQCIVADGGMSHRMIYHADEGWVFTPPGAQPAGGGPASG